ncbi:hypothetical protein BGX27_010286 [Mortierella sp. AM989]|nr:hypothetical protein BGX27_010286 [Mortierella sp. AM989]
MTTSSMTPPRSPFLAPSGMDKANPPVFPASSSSSSEVSDSASTHASGTSTPTSSLTSSLLLHDPSNANNDNILSQILILYHKATSTLLLRQLATSYCTCIEALELLAKTNKAYGLDQVTESLSTRRSYFVLKQKLWILNITIFGAMLSDRAENQANQAVAKGIRAGLRRRLMGSSKDNLEKLIKDLWRRLMEDYSGLEGDVDVQVMVAFALLCINQNLFTLARHIIEAYLATIPEGMLIHLETAALPTVQGNAKGPLMIYYERLVELYVVHVLAKLGEWENARQFLEFNNVLLDSSKQMYNTVLNKLQKKSLRPKKTAVQKPITTTLESSTSLTTTRSSSASSTSPNSMTSHLDSRCTAITTPMTTSKVAKDESALLKKGLDSLSSSTRARSQGLSSKAGEANTNPIISRSNEVSASTFQGRFWIFLQRYVDQIRSAGSRMGTNQMMAVVGVIVFLSTLVGNRTGVSSALQIVVEKVIQTVKMGTSVSSLTERVFLQGALDNIHYVFFELIFVLAFGKVFGIPDLSERLFPAQVAVHTAETVRPLKTIAVAAADEDDVPKKKTKEIVRKNPSSTGAVVKKPKAQPYAKEIAAMEKKLMDYINNTEIWEKVYEEDVRGKIEVYQYKARPMCYKIIAVMSNTPETTFDLLCDISRRVEWDPLCVEAKVITEIPPRVKIMYVRTKALWPTSSRDTLVLGTAKRMEDGRYMNVTSSVEHHLMPERTKEGIVRMDTALAAQIIGPEPGHPDKARLIQVLDTDLKGWIPDKVIQLVSTKAVPGGIRKVNKILRSSESYTESKTIADLDKALKAAEEAAEQQGGDAEGDDVAGEETSHELSSKRNSTLVASAAAAQETDNGKLYNQGAVERKRPSTFGVLWEGLKQNLGFGRSSGKANKALIAVLVLAILGPAFASLMSTQLSTILDLVIKTAATYPTSTKLGLAVVTYMAIVRHLRYRRINALLKKYPDPTLPLRDKILARKIASSVADYEFPYLNVVSLEFALFKTYAIPTISKILAGTKQFTNDCLKRTDDTVYVLLEITEWYSRMEYREKENGGKVDEEENLNDQRRVTTSFNKLNYMHGQYNIKEEDYLYTLALFVLEPASWINRFEWRELTELEKNAIFATWVYNGERMNIKNIPKTYQELTDWSEEYESKYMVYAKTNGIIADVTTDLLLSLAPSFMHPFGRQVVSTLLNDRLRTAFGIPPPPRGLTTVVIAGLRLRALFIRYFMLPRRYPLVRSALKADPKKDNKYVPRWTKYGVVYPDGYKVEDLGPKNFVGKCPFAFDIPNDIDPESLKAANNL